MIERSQVKDALLPKELYRKHAESRFSLLFDTPAGLQIFTPDRLKLDWWQAVGLITRYGTAGTLHCAGLDGSGAAFDTCLTLYVARDVREIPKLATTTWTHLAQLVMERAEPDYRRWWESLAHTGHHAVKRAAEFVLASADDARLYRPDFAAADFAVLNGKPFSLDPFTDIRLARWLGSSRGI